MLSVSVSKHLTAWQFMNSKSPQGIVYLASARIQCPKGEILGRIQFEHAKKKFRYSYDCLSTNEDLTYQTVVNGWTNYLGWVPHLVGKLGNVNFLDRQLLSCPEGGFLAEIRMEVDYEAEKLRYIYECGKISFGSGLKCLERQTRKQDPEDYFLPTLKHLDITCQPDEGLIKYQMRAEYETPHLWYNFTCCKLPNIGKVI